MNVIKNLLMLSSRQRKLCKRLEQVRGRLFRMAFAWSHDADLAEDVVQETMIKAVKNVDKVRDIKQIDSWLFRVLSNCFIDQCRKRRDDIDIDEITVFVSETPETIQNQNEMLASVRSAISTLPFKHRQVITLVDIESFSYADVADILGVPLGTIMSRLNRARQALRTILEQESVMDTLLDDNRDSGQLKKAVVNTAGLKVVK